MTPTQKTYTTRQVIEMTNYTQQRLSQLRLGNVLGKKNVDWYYEGKTCVFYESGVNKLLEYKKNKPKGGRPRKNPPSEIPTMTTRKKNIS